MDKSAKPLLVIAIDGPAGAGKSTVAKMLAERLEYRLLDTGALYRAVALLAKQKSIAWNDEEQCAALAANLKVEFKTEANKNRVWVDGTEVTDDIRTPEISQGASLVSSLPDVRAALLGLQRKLGEAGGVIVEGRDVGTVVFPSADVKIFLTASDEIRAKRRHAELTEKGTPADLQTTLTEMRERDRRDSGRQVAPLMAADDAIMLDSSSLVLDQVVAKIVEIVNAR